MTDRTEQNIERFEKELRTVRRDGMENLLGFIRSTDFYRAPASSRFHLSVPGGLLQHSLDVLDVLRGLLVEREDGKWEYRVAGISVEEVSGDNLVIMALLHDLCKIRFYTESTRNRKTKDGKWETYRSYEIDDQMPLGHGEKSVMLAQEYIKLDKVEAYGIRWHMGLPEGTEQLTFNNAVVRHPVVWAVHSADLMAAQLMEDKEDLRERFLPGPEEEGRPSELDEEFPFGG